MRFAILLHQFPDNSLEKDHFDLLLEEGGLLLTWRLPVQPLLSDGQCTATALPPHRLIYLGYEGPISGNRGYVQRVAAGELDWEGFPIDLTKPLNATLQTTDTWKLHLTPSAAGDSRWVVEWCRLR